MNKNVNLRLYNKQIVLFLITFFSCLNLGNGKPPEFLSQMIAEAREIRENLTLRSNVSCVITSAEHKDQDSKVIGLDE